MRALVLSVFLALYLSAGELNILAAANLKNVLEVIKQEFLSIYPDEKITITYLAYVKAYAKIKNYYEDEMYFSENVQKPQKIF